jgi:hypothetical protein
MILILVMIPEWAAFAPTARVMVLRCWKFEKRCSDQLGVIKQWNFAHACCMYFSFRHIDLISLIVLRNEYKLRRLTSSSTFYWHAFRASKYLPHFSECSSIYVPPSDRVFCLCHMADRIVLVVIHILILGFPY